VTLLLCIAVFLSAVAVLWVVWPDDEWRIEDDHEYDSPLWRYRR
jgi:hypothetical protein